MVAILPLSVASFIATWMLALIAFIFYKDGDDRRSLIFASCTVLSLLSVFSMLIPTYTVTEYPANSVYAGSPAFNLTVVRPAFSNPVITLYAVFGVFQSFIFFMFGLWSFKRRLQYKTFAQFEREMRARRFRRE